MKLFKTIEVPEVRAEVEVTVKDISLYLSATGFHVGFWLQSDCPDEEESDMTGKEFSWEEIANFGESSVQDRGDRKKIVRMLRATADRIERGAI